MDENEQARGELAEKLIKAIKSKLKGDFCKFFSYAWRENVEQAVATERKYTKLVEWLDNGIKERAKMAEVFCPADRNEFYTNKLFEIYMENIRDLAFMIHCHELLIDERTTIKMRQNIEYAITKTYGVEYDEFFDDYA